MEYEELRENLLKFFSDTSVSAEKTKAGLLSIAEEAIMLAETIEGSADFDE